MILKETMYLHPTDPLNHLTGQKWTENPNFQTNPLLMPMGQNPLMDILLNYQDILSYLTKNNKKSKVGKIYGMCSNAEMHQRFIKGLASVFEVGCNGVLEESLAIKSNVPYVKRAIFVPGKVRPVVWCRRTVYYMLYHFVDADIIKKPYLMNVKFTYADIFHFLLDRMMSIVNDLKEQSCSKHRGYIECLEIIIRFLIYSNEILLDYEKYCPVTVFKFIRHCMKLLIISYKDVNKVIRIESQNLGEVQQADLDETSKLVKEILVYQSPYEEEFWSYRLLLMVPNLVGKTNTTLTQLSSCVPAKFRDSEMVQVSLEACLAASLLNTIKYFEIMKSDRCKPLQAALMNYVAIHLRTRYLYEMVVTKTVKDIDPSNIFQHENNMGYLDIGLINYQKFLGGYNIHLDSVSKKLVYDSMYTDKLKKDVKNIVHIKGTYGSPSISVRVKLSEYESRQIIFDPDYKFPTVIETDSPHCLFDESRSSGTEESSYADDTEDTPTDNEHNTPINADVTKADEKNVATHKTPESASSTVNNKEPENVVDAHPVLSHNTPINADVTKADEKNVATHKTPESASSTVNNKEPENVVDAHPVLSHNTPVNADNTKADEKNVATHKTPESESSTVNNKEPENVVDAHPVLSHNTPVNADHTKADEKNVATHKTPESASSTVNNKEPENVVDAHPVLSHNTPVNAAVTKADDQKMNTDEDDDIIEILEDFIRVPRYDLTYILLIPSPCRHTLLWIARTTNDTLKNKTLIILPTPLVRKILELEFPNLVYRSILAYKLKSVVARDILKRIFVPIVVNSIYDQDLQIDVSENANRFETIEDLLKPSLLSKINEGIEMGDYSQMETDFEEEYLKINNRVVDVKTVVRLFIQSYLRATGNTGARRTSRNNASANRNTVNTNSAQNNRTVNSDSARSYGDRDHQSDETESPKSRSHNWAQYQGEIIRRRQRKLVHKTMRMVFSFQLPEILLHKRWVA
ncbi:conserved hypothetical protein [Theileria orientalis strain Shintoku]|uniref:SAC3/GANP/THP3 conserved domain-containing protein n=1 Tax=Theileria orientalis strain Shintoku TaxID=869250 RepID=J4CDV3_THEOR|nr:conserved hypothetical protein [Theileria orientalis strain Shintoku]BAM41792.1 conserved hypothetical protein [Theileria orientalis strain Shintoku]|eukprot:XP_009692093.1 conserved hypothetical protein [Theileria orientalis strain Shintoku]